MKRHPLTAEQKRLWLEWKKDPSSMAYRVAIRLELEGDIDVDRFRDSYCFIRDQLDSGRAYFEEERGADGADTAWQVILSPAEARERADDRDFEYVDLMGPADDPRERRRQAEDYVSRFVQRRIDPTRYPLWSASLVRYDERRFLFAGATHHIATDAFSFATSLGLLARRYNQPLRTQLLVRGARLLGKLPTMEKYLAWLDRNYPQQKREADAQYWRQVLEGAQYRVDFKLPPERARLPGDCGQPDPAGRVVFALDGALRSRLDRMVETEKTTLFVVLAAAFTALLHRLFDQNDVALYYPSSLRPKGFALLTGFLANTLVLRTRLEQGESFRSLVRKVSARRRADREHRYYPFHDLVTDCRRRNVEPPELRVGVSQTFFGLGGLQFRGLTARPYRPDFVQAMSDLDLLYDDDRGSGELLLGLEYRKTLFTEAFIERLRHGLTRLLDECLENPDAPLTQWALLSAEERQRVLVEWNRTGESPSTTGTFLDQWNEQVRRTPREVVATFGDSQLTYAELEERANRLAWLLRGRGVRRETRVAVCLERSLDLVVALWGTMKAGAAFVPLDPQYSRERLATMLADSEPLLLLTEHRLAEKVAGLASEIELLGSLDLAQQPGTAPPEGPAPEDLAYVVYTSGTTGKPKGILVEHGNLWARIASFLDTYEIASSDRYLHYCSPGFDSFVEELFLTPLRGGRIVLAPTSASADIPALARLVEKHQVTVMTFVPSFLSAFLRGLSEPRTCRTLRQLVLGGEEVTRDLLALVEQKLGGIRVLNLYGPTENTVNSTLHVCSAADAHRPRVPIGRPLAYTTAYVLRGTEPVPPGVLGELFVGGAGVARGYLKLPEQTAERFVPNPFGPGRLYRTGDLVRQLEDGTLEFHGRTDDQIKLGGVRMEPAEIEAAILGTGLAEEAVVVLRTEESGRKYLAAYVVPKQREPEPGKLVGALREQLRLRLPRAMVPAGYCVMAEIPRNANLKVDRSRLPQPELAQAAAYEAPRDSREEKLAALWARLLGAARVGINDNFFDMGGDSLLAIRAATAMRDELGLEVGIHDFFQHPTIAGLMARLAPGVERTSEPICLTDQRGGHKLFLLHHGIGISTKPYRELALRLPGYEVWAINNPRIGEAKNFASIEEMAREYVAMIERTAPDGPYRLGGFCMGGMIAYEVARQLTARGRAVECVVLINSEAAPDPLRHHEDEAVRKFDALVEEHYADWLVRKSGFAPGTSEYALILREVQNTSVVLDDYRRKVHGLPYEGRVVLIRARDQESYGFEQELLATGRAMPGFEELAEQFTRERLLHGWSHLTARGLHLELVSTPGRHHDLFAPEFVDETAERVRWALQGPPDHELRAGGASLADRYLLHAARNNDAFVVEALLDRERFLDLDPVRDVDRSGADGRTAMHWARFHANERMMRRLAAAGARTEG